VVLAGNFREFKFWCMENNVNPRDRNVIYASEPHRIRGLGPIRYVLYGTWYSRRDAWEMLDYLKHLEKRYQNETSESQGLGRSRNADPGERDGLPG
jgi:hypothetical protein